MFLFYRNDPYGQGVPILPQEDQSQNQNQNYQAPNILNPAAEGMDEIMRAAANLENSILHRHNPQRQLLWSPYQTQDGRLFLSGETVNYYHTLYSSQYQHYRGGYGGPRDPRDFENTNFIRPLPVYPRQVQYYNGVEYYYANPQQCNYYYYPQNPFTDMTYGGPPAMPPPQQGAPAPPPPVTYNNNNNHNNNNNNKTIIMILQF
ncbi:hypothetical protein ADEAN_000310100 [Angomonas deanei]|uniref:Uncharacterized protein n=1 Tax=Angomonas deanei TaxID=59799 RepID=A0A7G2C7C0_9TRYP|nr:hypothetical protein ADEAN_000310100 [Angomonas deanei]